MPKNIPNNQSRRIKDNTGNLCYSDSVVRIEDIDAVFCEGQVPIKKVKLRIYDGISTIDCFAASSLIDKFSPVGPTKRSSIIKMTKYRIRNIDGRDAVYLDDFEHLSYFNHDSVSNNSRNMVPKRFFRKESGGVTEIIAEKQFESTPIKKLRHTENSNDASLTSRQILTDDDHLTLNSLATVPLNSTNFKIKCRVVKKSGIKTYRKRSTEEECSYLQLHFSDRNDEISAVTFGQNCCTKFYDLLQLHEVYEISNARVIRADKKYSCLRNERQLILTPTTTVERCSDFSPFNYPTHVYHFSAFNTLNEKQVDEVVDVIGVMLQINEVKSGETKSPSSNTENNNFRGYKKRDVLLYDASRLTIKLTLWGSLAENFPDDINKENNVLAIKGVRIKSHNGELCLSASENSEYALNPPLPETQNLKRLISDRIAVEKTNANEHEQPGTYTQRMRSNFLPPKTIATITLIRLAERMIETIFFVKAVVMDRNRTTGFRLYKACLICNCKINDDSDNNGNWNCSKCKKASNAFSWRILLNVMISDFSGSIWITMFNYVAENLLSLTSGDKLSADYLALIKDEDELSTVLDTMMFRPLIFKLSSSWNEFNGEMRLKTICHGIYTVDHTSYIKQLQNEVQEMQGH